MSSDDRIYIALMVTLMFDTIVNFTPSEFYICDHLRFFEITIVYSGLKIDMENLGLVSNTDCKLREQRIFVPNLGLQCDLP